MPEKKKEIGHHFQGSDFLRTNTEKLDDSWEPEVQHHFINGI